ncbi:hypothetical protein ACFX1Q_023920 [Malus domestica]
MDPGSLIPHWLTSQGHQYLNRQNAHHQMQAGLTLVVIHEIREDDTQTRGELALSRVMVNGTQSKRGTDVSVIEIHHTLIKKSKKVENSEERKKRVADKLRRMSIKERCLMMEKALYAEEESEETPEEYKEMWEFMENISKTAKRNLQERSEGSSSQGGGSWPNITARSP